GPAPRVYGDSLYVALGVTDTLWALPLSLQGSGRALPLNSAAMAQSPAPPQPGPIGPAVREWLAGATFLGDFVRLSDGRWLIATWRPGDGGVLWGLALVDHVGNPIWELNNAPRLLEVDEEDRLYLWDPASLDPGMVQVARLR